MPSETVSPWAPIASGEHTFTLSFGGLEREYVLHIPPGYDHSQPAALVLAYHGYNLNASEMMRISGFSTLADAENFLVAYPQGSGTRQSWNGGTCCGEALQQRVDDVGFTRAVIEDIARQANLDRSRVYATGFSNGAIMAYRLACDLADQLAAIAPVSAAPAVITCSPSQPVAVIHFHGDADSLNPYEGGERPNDLPDFMAVEAGINLWLGLDGCPFQAQETQQGNIVHRVYGPCQGGTAVELYKIIGGEHAWPGGEAVSGEIGEPTDEVDATALIWAFFEQHPRP
jgi:polyhydroxybutyrate depolymerase